MDKAYLVKWLILYLSLLPSAQSFEIFIQRTDGLADQPLKSFSNQTYQIPLFQTRRIAVKMHPDHLRHRTDQQIVGFAFEIQSTKSQVVQMEKELSQSTGISRLKSAKTILLEDLFITSRKNALGHIFNAYPSPSLIEIENEENIDITWSMTAEQMGITDLTFSLVVFYDDDSSSTYPWSLRVLVVQPKRVIDKIFQYMLPFLVIFISTQMGILLDTKILFELVKKPKPVLIGFVAQYGLMPFIALAITKIFRYEPLHGLALFLIGCCPGSGASNQWTLLFDGDVNLSAIMSFVSTASSFVMMPLYFYTLGRIYTDELAIRVPFLGLVRTLALVVLPYGLGIVISHFSPGTRALVQKLVKPMMLFFLVFFLVFGTVVNWYLVQTIDLYTALTAPLLPYLGFILGAVLAWICRCDWTHVKTIGIEAGIQNVGVAFMIIYYSFPQPYASQAIVVPLVVAFLTTKPFWLVYIIRNRINKYKKKKEIETQDGKIILTDVKPNGNNPSSTKEDIAEIMQTL